jgi:hypothetical protein
MAFVSGGTPTSRKSVQGDGRWDRVDESYLYLQILFTNYKKGTFFLAGLIVITSKVRYLQEQERVNSFPAMGSYMSPLRPQASVFIA